MRYAVVDIGTNSIRLMIARVSEGCVVSEMKTLRTIRLGEGMVDEKRINDAALERAKSTLIEYKEISKSHRAQDNFYCFATSAVREAVNRNEFIDFIRKECGIEVEIISGDSEAILGFAGSVRGRGGMFDIGGGSTEIMIGTLEDIKFMKSFGIGTVKCLQMFPGADMADQNAYRKAHKLARNIFNEIPHTHNVEFTGIGGSATALAAIDLGLAEYLPELIQGHRITLEGARRLCRMLERMTKEERKSIIGLEEKRADVIVFGAIILLEFMEAVSAASIIVSDSDNQEGYLAMKLGKH